MLRSHQSFVFPSSSCCQSHHLLESEYFYKPLSKHSTVLCWVWAAGFLCFCYSHDSCVTTQHNCLFYWQLANDEMVQCCHLKQCPRLIWLSPLPSSFLRFSLDFVKPPSFPFFLPFLHFLPTYGLHLCHWDRRRQHSDLDRLFTKGKHHWGNSNWWRWWGRWDHRTGFITVSDVKMKLCDLL